MDARDSVVGLPALEVVVTCVVGIAEAGRVWIAADSCLAVGDAEYESASPKVTQRDGWVWGMAGTWKAIVVIRDGLDVPPADVGDVGEFVWRAFSLLKANGLEDESPDLLIGLHGRLYAASEPHDWHCVPEWQSGRRRRRVPRSWHAVGCGAPYALGCLDGIADSDLTPEQRYTEALTVASRRVSGVRQPWRHVEA